VCLACAHLTVWRLDVGVICGALGRRIVGADLNARVFRRLLANGVSAWTTTCHSSSCWLVTDTSLSLDARSALSAVQSAVTDGLLFYFTDCT
jgi:hypothetical protein